MKRVIALALIILVSGSLMAQSAIFVPSAKPIRNMKKALHQPETFCLLIQYSGNDTTYSIADLDLLDSAYDIAFDIENPKFYTMRIEGFGDNDFMLNQERVNSIYHYFARRSHSPFPVRIAQNKVSCSCHGDTVEQIRYEVPIAVSAYDVAELPESRRVINKTIKLENCVLVTFNNSPDECIGTANGCYLPTQDTVIRGYYATLEMPRGAVYSVNGTKDSCPEPLSIDIEEHLDYNTLVERYFLVPHAKQIIVHAGYVVLKSNFNRAFDECEKPLNDSIFLRIPITQEQWDGKLRAFAKKPTDKGPEYRMLSTRKITNRTTKQLYLQVAINPTMFDTIFFGKRVKADEISDYLYKVDSDREEGVVEIKGKYYAAYRMNRHGEYESRKALRVLFHTEIEQEEPEEEKSNEKAKDPDSEEIED